MRTVWKYPLRVDDVQEIVVPDGSEILSVQVQNGQPCVWVLVNKHLDAKYVQRLFMFGTGHPIDQEDIRFVGTFQMHDGALVFHLFEETTQ